jgi:hypothetical protein
MHASQPRLLGSRSKHVVPHALHSLCGLCIYDCLHGCHWEACMYCCHGCHSAWCCDSLLSLFSRLPLVATMHYAVTHCLSWLPVRSMLSLMAVTAQHASPDVHAFTAVTAQHVVIAITVATAQHAATHSCHGCHYAPYCYKWLVVLATSQHVVTHCLSCLPLPTAQHAVTHCCQSVACCHSLLSMRSMLSGTAECRKEGRLHLSRSAGRKVT